ncbi:Ankyrin-1 [Paramyrothecium foliicola]|nr:Ankyrin-1 [Paramyrothecium foliicola]
MAPTGHEIGAELTESDFELISRDAVPAPAVQTRIALEKRLSTIQNWLQPTEYLSPGNEFMKHIHAYVPGTGSWVRESAEFRSWTQADAPNSGCLAIKGVAGSGKSVFAASTIRQLQEIEPGVPVLFFFFRQIVEKNHSAQYLIRDFASQLVPHSPSLLERLEEISKSHGVNGNEKELLWPAVTQAMASLDKVYCVADALDEMDDGDFDMVRSLTELGGDGIRVLLTSRPIPKIEESLRSSRTPYLKLEPALIYPDVARYVRVSMGALEPSLSPEKEDLVANSICERAKGLFLHARLMTDNLSEGLATGRLTEETLPGSLERLPTSLKDVYEEMLVEHSRRSGVERGQQASILMCVTHSTRPLRLIELGSLVARMRGHDDLGEGKFLVRASCGRLLEILEDETVSVIHHSFTEFLRDKERSYDRDSFPVLKAALAHEMLATLSLHYLDGCPQIEIACKDRWEYVQVPEDSSNNGLESSCDVEGHNANGTDKYGDFVIRSPKAQECKDLFQKVALNHPLAAYAVDNLFRHIKQAGDNHRVLQDALDQYLNPDRPAFGLWMLRNGCVSRGFTVLHLASIEGNVGYVQHIAARNSKVIDLRDGDGRTPLSYTAAKGHTEITRLLLDSGANVNSDSWSGKLPLHYAAEGGHPATVSLLLNAGADPVATKTRDTPDRDWELGSDKQETPLELASKKEHTEIIGLFLPKVSATDANRCLHWVRRVESIEAILATGHSNVDSFMNGRTKLFEAARRHDYETIELLLIHGADPNRRCTTDIYISDGENDITDFVDFPRGPTSMHAFAGYCDDTIFYTTENLSKAQKSLQLLLRYGADPNMLADRERNHANDGDYTPLHFAVRKKYDWMFGRSCSKFQQMQEALVSMLISQGGADPNARSKIGRTPLHESCSSQPGLIDILLRHGADVNIMSDDGLSPLLALMQPMGWRDEGPNISVFEKLIENGADLNLATRKGNTVLHLVFMDLKSYTSAHIPFLQRLLQAGASFSTKNNDGQIPLLEYRCERWVKQLESEEQVLSALIEAGLDVDACNDAGHTILWKLLDSYEPNMDVFNMFTRLGANPQMRDAEGNTLLHLAVRRGRSLEWVRLLVSLGVDPRLMNDQGFNVIHLALLADGYQMSDTMILIQEFIHKGVSATKRTGKKQTVLHLASSIPFHGSSRHDDDWIDFVLKTSLFGVQDPNTPDADGATPLHYAASISDHSVQKLLHLGADPMALATDGLSLLHIACVARSPNTVGLLLKCYKERGVLKRFVNLASTNGSERTALHYACRSGCPESVGYLLANGANPLVPDKDGRTPLHALAEYPVEQKLWMVHKSDELAFVNVDSKWRPSKNRFAYSSFYDGTPDILPLLLEAGARPDASTSDEDGSLTVMEVAIKNDCKVLVRELMRRGLALPHGPCIDLTSIEDHLGMIKPDNAEKISRSSTHWIHERLQEGDHDSIKEFARSGSDLMAAGTNGGTILHRLVSSGSATLLRHFKDEAVQLENKFWAEDDENNPGTLLATALGRQSPNLPVIKVLVEEFGMNVNASSKQRGIQKLTDATPLHIAASGQYFWHKEAVEYLLVHGADPTATNALGQIPLLTAISTEAPDGQWKEETISALLRHSNPNAIEAKSGRSCIELADSARVMQMLLDYNAILLPGTKALANAIRLMQPDMVSLVLEQGVDPNQLHDETYLLQTAALLCYEKLRRYKFDFRSRQMQVINELMEYSADSNASYDDGSFVLQHVVKSHGCFEPLLEAEGLSIGRKGELGQTLLISACSPFDTQRATNLNRRYHEPKTRAFVEAAVALLKRGAAVDGCDEDGMTALHRLCTVTCPADQKHNELLAALVNGKPSMIHVADRHGSKPLHLALLADQDTFVQYLLDQGADPADPDPEGNTALHHYARRMTGKTEPANAAADWFRRFLEMGLTIDARNNRGETPLAVFMSSGWRKARNSADDTRTHHDDAVLSVFQNAGADWHTVDKEGSTLLHILGGLKLEHDAYEEDRDATFAFEKLLKEKHLDPRREDVHLRTPIDLAVARDKRRIIDLFSEKSRQAVR